MPCETGQWRANGNKDAQLLTWASAHLSHYRMPTGSLDEEGSLFPQCDEIAKSERYIKSHRTSRRIQGPILCFVFQGHACRPVDM